ncbi:MAG: putative 2OG-Fe(II) oxygenase [Usitatibacter sp.]
MSIAHSQPTRDRAADAERWRTALRSDPRDRIAWHNLASAEGDLGRAAEAESAARRAIALGLPAPETRLVLARALQAQHRLDEAERAFDEALSLRPLYADAHRDLAQLVWMRTGKSGFALKRVERALRSAPREGALHLIRSIVLEVSGDREAAFGAALAGLTTAPRDAGLLLQASHLCAETGDAKRALDFAQQARRASPDSATSSFGLCEALLAAERVEEAEAVATELRASHPHNQYAIALQATAWRLRGDGRYGALVDYSQVSARKLDTPPGWTSLDEFLAALAADLDALHAFDSHPLQQSVRGGSQLPLNAPELARPLVAALFACIERAVGAHVEAMGTGPGALRSRNAGRHAIAGAWSVRLRSGGYHTDHVHPEGWLSSACYIALPPRLGEDAADRSGWLRLGRPGIPTGAPLDAEHFVKPEPGLLVLFPAYLWHGVEPFESDSPRLSVAFDVVPG